MLLNVTFVKLLKSPKASWKMSLSLVGLPQNTIYLSEGFMVLEALWCACTELVLVFQWKLVCFPCRYQHQATCLDFYGVISVSKFEIPDVSVHNFMQAFVTSCKRSKTLCKRSKTSCKRSKTLCKQSKLYASGQKLDNCGQNFVQVVPVEKTSCKRSLSQNLRHDSGSTYLH